MDRFQELRAFIAVVEAGGFTAAARRIGETQPAVSKAVSGLERRLGTTLFHRSTRSVTLTDQGQRYYARTKPLLEEMEEADNELARRSLAVSGVVRIATSYTLGRLHVLPLLPELLSQNPGLKIDMILSDLARDMVEDGIDLAIRGGRVDQPDAVVRRIAGTPLVCVGSRRYFEERGLPTAPDHLRNHNCLIYGGHADASHWEFVGPGGPLKVAVRGNLSSNSLETIRAAVLDGLGIGLLAKVTMWDELENPEVVTVLGDYLNDVRDISLVWPERRFVPARVRTATEFFAAAIPLRM